MSLTAFLPTGAPQVLPFIGTPGAATVGHALLWSESPQGFTLAPISVGPDQFSGVLPVEKGGWGTDTGSFTSPGAITLAAGGTNQNIILQPSGAGYVFSPGLVAGENRESPSLSELNGLPRPSQLIKLNSQLNIEYFVASDVNVASTVFLPTRARGTVPNPQPVRYGDRLFLFGAVPYGFDGPGNLGTGLLIEVDLAGSGQVTQRNPPTVTKFLGVNQSGSDVNFLIVNSSQAYFPITTESTSTTTGAVRVDGGLGVAKNLNIGGNLKVAGTAINFANLPTSSANLAVGDLWRDSDTVKVKL